MTKAWLPKARTRCAGMDRSLLAKWRWQISLPQCALSMTEGSGTFLGALPEQTVCGCSQYGKADTEGL